MARNGKNGELDEALSRVFVSPNEGDSNGEPANLVDAVFALARAVDYAGLHLGLGEASDRRGALAVFGAEILDGCRGIAGSLGDIADALNRLADSAEWYRQSEFERRAKAG